MTKEDIQKLIDAKPSYISISDIEKKVGMPATTLQKTLKGERELPIKWIKPLQDFLGLKKAPEAAPAVKWLTKSQAVKKTAPKQPLTTSQVIKKAHKAMGQEAVFVTTPKKYADYMKMTGIEIKEHWEEIKKTKLTPGQRSTLYAKISGK